MTQLQLSRRQFIQLSGVVALSTSLAACNLSNPSQASPTAESAVANPEEALQRLIAGNQRYAANKTVDPNQTETRRVEVAQGQHPFATILGCVDSRVPPEIVFDRGLGDLFVIRTAGQVIDSAVLGSIEFGTAELGISLIMVLGHENCGAIKATIETIEKNTPAKGSIGALVEGIRPAVEQVQGREGDLVDNAVRANIALVVEQLQTSPVLSEALRENKLKIVGGRYDLDSGTVEMIVG